MSRRSIALELLPLTTPDTPGSADGYFGPTKHYLEVEVSYNEGGMNYFSGSRAARGYYLRVTPVTRQTINRPDGSSGAMSGFTMFSGQSMLLAEAKRFSAPTLAKVAAGAKSHGFYESLKRAVLQKENLTIVEEGS